MILLDTDHLTVLKYFESERCVRLMHRLREAAVPVATSAPNAEEQLRGWLSVLAKERKVQRQVFAYRELVNLIRFLAGISIVDFDDIAVAHFERLRAARVRIATSDLKVASVALANGALLLSANQRDFEQVPELRFENWMD